MSKALQIAWTVPRSEGLDLKEFALGVLEIAKENLQRDGNLRIMRRSLAFMRI